MPWPRRIRLRALAAGGEEHLRRRRVAVLLEEVVLDLPDVLEPERIGRLDLLQCLVEQAMFGIVSPWSPHLMLVEHAELHRPDVDTCIQGVNVDAVARV